MSEIEKRVVDYFNEIIIRDRLFVEGIKVVGVQGLTGLLLHDKDGNIVRLPSKIFNINSINFKYRYSTAERYPDSWLPVYQTADGYIHDRVFEFLFEIWSKKADVEILQYLYREHKKMLETRSVAHFNAVRDLNLSREALKDQTHKDFATSMLPVELENIEFIKNQKGLKAFHRTILSDVLKEIPISF